jgi:hypothetical protein
MDNSERALIDSMNIDFTTISSIPYQQAWKLQLNMIELKTWLKHRATHSFFFDGASKGNLGEAGAGGVILGLRGEIETTYAWSLGKVTNNQVEAYALLKGLELAKIKGISSLTINGYSRIILSNL